ncbi:VWA domain-containing protein [Ciceribacter sp. L1K23]|uniref:TadE/TadG family type IV pilus assembly protein n=1 Tax=unclassified Ciceribacter TaxID=2628820 RepID=UPI001ABDDAF6|nr:MULTISPECIES: TadE/TadG family type IV pilus assembly protein [unclassified Ciceribacter]MBO3762011.1 VWA domain-containing protein [Ciceribacter sp. L1K22]MBR0558141.1 VWA domain-containing protein [Ciceribacter sp. L1K23]
MLDARNSKNPFKKLVADRSGNFGIMTAFLLPVVLATGGIAIDLTRMVQVRSELQNAADAASLAAATAMASKGISEEEAVELAREFLGAQMANLVGSSSGPEGDGVNEELERLKQEAVINAVSTSTSKSANSFDVTVNANYTLGLNGLTALLGFKQVTLAATSTSQSATESKNALSMFLVVDRSGSMGENTNTVNPAQPTKQEAYGCGWSTCYRTVTNYIIKIDALKAAVADLAAQLDEADPDTQYVRTGTVSYNSSTQTETKLAWGTAKSLSYVNALSATGGTASTGAVKLAYQSLIKTSENTAHKNKNGQVPSKYIVFLTDGDNNNTSDDTATKSWCDKAKADGIEIYSVAFMAPSRGQALLSYCASTSSHYFDANDAEELVASFRRIGEEASQAGTRLTN